MTAGTPDQPLETASIGRRTGVVIITVAPFLGLVAAIGMLWNTAVGWTDLALFAGLYLLCGFGITIGYHRMLTHRAFEAVAPLKAALLIAGSIAIQGRAIDWAVDHRTHHAFSDKEGDPHSPHAGFENSVWGHLKGLLHAHVGWMFEHSHRTDRERYAKDLLTDRMVLFVDRTFPLWVVVSFVVPFAVGGLITRTWEGAVTGLVWGGLVRLFFNHHVTWSVNSICHFFGRRPFRANDHSTNNWVLALPSLGESWHHNHHVFPTSAFHGLRRSQLDPSGLLIAVWEKLGLVRNVRRPSSEQIHRKLQTSG